MSDFVVRIQYKNKDLETVVEKEYEFIDYTEMLNLNLKRILSEIRYANKITAISDTRCLMRRTLSGDFLIPCFIRTFRLRP